MFDLKRINKWVYKKYPRVPMQIQTNHQNICSDISRERVQPHLQHSAMTHGCACGGKALVASGKFPSPSLSLSRSVSRHLSQVRLLFSLLPTSTFCCLFVLFSSVSHGNTRRGAAGCADDVVLLMHAVCSTMKLILKEGNWFCSDFVLLLEMRISNLLKY